MTATPEPAAADEPDGRVIGGRYRIRRLLGRGGMGAVWAAHDEVLGREVAIKEVLPSPGLTPEQQDAARQRTLREARAAARLDHPSAVTVYDVVEGDGGPWIVMQLLAPNTLADLLADGRRLSPVAAAGIGVDLLAALQAAHRAGVLHRDVKPANVMLSETGRAVLTDFGIATLTDDPTLTSTGMIVGSPGYMSPERARGERPTPASDLWSLGATLYAAVEGESPFRRDGQLLTLNAVITQPAPPARHAGPLRPVIASLLARDPADRPSGEQVHTLLSRIKDAPDEPTAQYAPSATETTSVDLDPTFVAWRDAAIPAPPPPKTPRPTPPVAAPRPAPVEPSRIEPARNEPARNEPAPRTEPVVAPAAAPRSSVTPSPPVRSEPVRSEPARSRSSRRPFIFVAVVGTVLVLAAALWATRLFGSPSTPSATGANPRASTASTAAATTAPSTAASTTTAPSTPATTKAATTTTPSSARPAGFTTHRDPSGFSIATPKGWVRSTKGGSVYYRQPGGRSYLLIDQTNHPKANALSDWRRQEKTVSQRLSGYQRIRLEKVSFRGWDAADWEFTWRPSGGTLHVLNRNIRVSDTRAYALYWSVPAQSWTQRQSDFAAVAASFKPAS